MQTASEDHAEIRKSLRRVSRNLAEATDKLNGLIGYMDGQHKPPQ
jgi:hypothetical protein